MKWEIWDADVKAVLEPSGGCENGTTFIFEMKSGQKVNCIISDVVQHESIKFSGGMFGGKANFVGIVQLKPTQTAGETTVDYTFGVGGLYGPVISMVAKKDIEEGTEKGLQNIVRLSEEAQAKK